MRKWKLKKVLYHDKTASNSCVWIHVTLISVSVHLFLQYSICKIKSWSRDNPEKAMAPHSSTLAWRVPWTEEPGGLQSMGSLRVRHDRATSLSLFCTGEGNGNPLQCSCLENPRDGGAWWTAVSGVTQSQTQLMRLSSLIIYYLVSIRLYIFFPENFIL